MDAKGEHSFRMTPHEDIASMMRRSPITRRRYQAGQLIEEHDRWSARWREDVLQADGTVKRVRRWDVLAMKPCAKREAMRLLGEKMREVNNPGRKPTSTETFARFADRWMATVMIHHGDSTQVEERRQIERDLKPVFGPFPLRDVTAEVVQTWVSGMALAPKTVANRAGTLRTMWATAKAWGYVQHDPFEGLKLPTREAAAVYQFSAEEMMQVIHEARGWYGLFFELLAKTGMRPGEAGGLRPEDIEGRTLRVQQTVWKGRVRPRKTKTAGSKRTFVISDALADKLRSHIAANPNQHGLIFTNQGGSPMNMDHFNQKVLRPILERTGIWAKIPEGMRCGNYAFRHGNITEMDRSGVPMKTIQARVGHAIGSDVTRKHYSHAVSADDVAAADLMELLLSPKREGEAVQ
jgi:integrase